MLSLPEINEITSHWDIPISTAETLSERALLLHTSSEEEIVLKKKGIEEIASNEIKLLLHLHKHDFKVQVPLAATNGKYIISYNGENYCMFTYIKGEVFSAMEALENNCVPQLLGKNIASLHKALEKDDSTDYKFSKKDLYQQVYGWAVDEILNSKENEPLKELFEKLQTEFQEKIELLPKQLIHRDAHFKNIIFHDNNFAGFIDFEIAENNVRLFDICYCSTSVLNEVFSEERMRDKWITFVEALFENYQAVNKLSPIEKYSIWHVMLAIQAIFMAYFAKDAFLFNINKDMFLWIYNIKSRIVEVTIK